MRRFLYILSLALIPLISMAQNNPAPEKKENKEASEPLELPNFIIVGTEKLNVRSGIKQSPNDIPRLSRKELDSINSMEKQKTPPIPVESLPNNIETIDYQKGYLKANAGLMQTLGIEGGYGFNIEGYELYANAGLEKSGENSHELNYNKGFFKLTSDFIAPEKYFIFGGSRTRTTLLYDAASYSLYSTTPFYSRNKSDLLVKVDVDGNYGGVQFQTGAGYRHFGMSTDATTTMDSPENTITGYVKASNLWDNFIIAGNLSLDLRSLRNIATNFIQADGSISVYSDDFSLTGTAGLQIASNSDAVDRGGLYINGTLEYRISKIFTVNASLSSGLENSSFSRFATLNPYLADNAKFDYMYNIAFLRARLIYHPSEVFYLAFGTNLRIADRYPIFVLPDSTGIAGTFDLNYEKAQINEIIVEGYYYLSPTQSLIGNFTYTQSSLTDLSAKLVPNVPDLKISGAYRQTFGDKFGIKVGVDYIGKRYADKENVIELEATPNLKASAEYRFDHSWKATFGLENILNSNIYIWNAYKERSMYAFVNIMWQF